MNDMDFTDLTPMQQKMFTDNGDVKLYVNSDKVFPFPVGTVADISFPTGYNKGGARVHDICPALNCTTYSCFVVKVNSIIDVEE